MSSFDSPPAETSQRHSAVLDEPSSPVSLTGHPEIEAREPRNLIALAAHHIVLRVAWIFKTESVIMPAFMDAISGAGWLRGCLPVFNRVGQSVPSLLLADRLRRTRKKKWPLLVTSLLMAVPFLVLSLLWLLLEEKRQGWLPGVFLLLYFFFFSVTGLNQLAFGTIQGKLIRPHRRGRLLGLSGTLGAVAAITCAWFLLQSWVKLPEGGFEYIFAFTGCGFLVAGLISTFVYEPADPADSSPRAAGRHFRDAWASLRADADFRGLCIVAMLFMTAQMLFPHYQALARGEPEYESFHLMLWVVAQNAGAGLFSPVVGAIADRWGNRLAVRFEIVFVALTPLLAVGLLLTGWVDGGVRFFWVTFLFLGLVPVTVKTMVNYTLELSEPEKHPRYISILKLSMALPFVLSPLVGWLVDLVGFGPVFAVISGLVAVGGLRTLRLVEPRQRA